MGMTKDELRAAYPKAMTEDEFTEKYVRPATAELVRKFLAGETLDNVETILLNYCLDAGPVRISRLP